MKLDQRGKIDLLKVALIFFVVASLGLGLLAFMTANDLSQERTDRDGLVEEQVAAARTEIQADEAAKFAEREKSPFSSYESAEQLGSLEVVYPKTWSAYVEESVGSGNNINAYFHPGYVRSLNSDTRVALRLTLESKDYTTELRSFENDIEKGVLTSAPITLSGTRGVRLDGEIAKDVQGSMIILPLREKTLKFWTESNDFQSDFTNTIIENITFVP